MPAPRCPLFSAVFPLLLVTNLHSWVLTDTDDRWVDIYPWTFTPLLGKNVSPWPRRFRYHHVSHACPSQRLGGSCSCYFFCHLNAITVLSCSIAELCIYPAVNPHGKSQIPILLPLSLTRTLSLLSRPLAELCIYSAGDPLGSKSRMLNPRIVSLSAILNELDCSWSQVYGSVYHLPPPIHDGIWIPKPQRIHFCTTTNCSHIPTPALNYSPCATEQSPPMTCYNTTPRCHHNE